MKTNLRDLDAEERNTVRNGRSFGYATVGDYVLLAPGISDRAVRIYCLLRMHCRDQSESAYPSLKTLGEMLGIKKTDGISKAIQELVELGAVEVTTIAHAHGRRNVYSVHEAPPEDYTRGPKSRTDFYRSRDKSKSDGVTPCWGVTPREGGMGHPPRRGDGSPPAGGSEGAQEEVSQTETKSTSFVAASGSTQAGDHPTAPDEDLFGTGLTQDQKKPDGSQERDQTRHGGDQRPPKAKRGTRIPEDFASAITPAMVTWAQENAPHVDGRFETEQFVDYWLSKAGKDAVKLDWVRTWQTWMRRAEQQTARSSRNGHARRSATSVAHAEIDAAFDSIFGSSEFLELSGGSR